MRAARKFESLFLLQKQSFTPEWTGKKLEPHRRFPTLVSAVEQPHDMSHRRLFLKLNFQVVLGPTL